MPGWRDDAACTSVPTEMFYTDGAPGQCHQREYNMAKQICFGCPVKEDCLAEAMQLERNSSRSDRAGIWGGLGPRERHNMWKKIKTTDEAFCKEGHAMDKENVYRNPSGSAYCRKCRAIWRKNRTPPKRPKATLG